MEEKIKVCKKMSLEEFIVGLKESFIPMKKKLEKEHSDYFFSMDVVDDSKDDDVYFVIDVISKVNKKTMYGKVGIERKIIKSMAHQPFIDVILKDIYYGFIEVVERIKEE